ncbi:hypothetical protein O9993_20125 [Vibrio lentus]|nr:hypothetical protein [Vibrio lentus]
MALLKQGTQLTIYCSSIKMVLAMALALLYRLMMGDLTASLAKTGG